MRGFLKLKERSTDLAAVVSRIGFWLGPILFVVIYFFVNPKGMPEPAITVMAVTSWIAIWWITEPVPLPVTSLLPIILFPLLGVTKLGATTSSYAEPIIFLFIGGFLIAIAIEKTGLHKRIALNIIRRMGTKLNMIVLGFMISTAFISMWISNTATAIMMLPIGLAIVAVTTTEDDVFRDRFRKSLMLAIAYSASIGGLATIIGTPPNLVFIGVVRDLYQTDITFIQWFYIGFPISVLLLFASWWYLVNIGFPLGNTRLSGGPGALDKHLEEVGNMSAAEKRVAIVFVCVAVAWIIRSFILEKIIPGIDDTIISVAGGMSLFLIPSGDDKNKLLTWADSTKLPWGIILLFGGGLALADAFESSGLAAWIGDDISAFAGMGLFLVLLLVVALVTFLTEFTSNLAVVTMLLPVIAPVAVSAGVHPYVLMVGCTLAASCGFMMPAGTPPNAIAFGSGYLSIWDMVKAGFWLDLISITIITVIIYFLIGPAWGI
jgi:sodium-dependent dicarboxylate transporter 2/3/5